MLLILITLINFIKIFKILNFLEDFDGRTVANYQFLELNGKIIPIFNVSGDDENDNWIMLDNSKKNIFTIDDFKFLTAKYKLLINIENAFGADDEEGLLVDAKKRDNKNNTIICKNK